MSERTLIVSGVKWNLSRNSSFFLQKHYLMKLSVLSQVLIRTIQQTEAFTKGGLLFRRKTLLPILIHKLEGSLNRVFLKLLMNACSKLLTSSSSFCLLLYLVNFSSQSTNDFYYTINETYYVNDFWFLNSTVCSNIYGTSEGELGN